MYFVSPSSAICRAGPMRKKVDTARALVGRRPVVADVDTLDRIFRGLNASLRLPIGAHGAAVELKFESLHDFHPDQLYARLELFSELAGLRRRLKNTSTFAAAANEMQAWPAIGSRTNAAARSPAARGLAMPPGKLSDFARLIGRSAPAVSRDVSIDALIQQVVAPFVVPAPHPEQEGMVAAVDEALSDAMRQILHHPDFQGARVHVAVCRSSGPGIGNRRPIADSLVRYFRRGNGRRS